MARSTKTKAAKPRQHVTDHLREPGRRWLRNRKFYFDKSAADRAVAWIETYCHHTEGEWYGRPFILAHWQRRIVRKLFGWKRVDGTRRFRKLWLEVGRKNGKTEFAAALALLLFIGDGEMGGQIYSLATDKDQARIVFDKASKMVGLAPEDLRREIEILKPSLWCNALIASFKPLSSKPDSKHGFSPHGVIGDEVHAWESSELYEVVIEGEGARNQPLNVLITTAGRHGEGYAWEQHEYALGVLKGEFADDELLVMIFAAGEDDDWTDIASWKKANPNLGISPKIDFLEGQCREARQLPRKENRFRQYYLNQWVEQSTRWLPMEFWNMCTSAPDERAKKLFLSDSERDEKLISQATAGGSFDPDLWKKLPEKMKGRSTWGGLDLATTTDLAALVWDFGADENDIVTYLWRFFLPRDTLKTVSPRTQKLYQKFIDHGALTLTPGNVADYSFIEKQILQDSEQFRIAALGIDRWNATDLATRLLNNEGLPVELFGQGFASMSGPSKEFERRVLGLSIEHGNNPVAAWMAKNVAVDQDAVDNIKPTKERSADKIDGIVAAIMARGMAMAHPVSAAKSFWEAAA